MGKELCSFWIRRNVLLGMQLFCSKDETRFKMSGVQCRLFPQDRDKAEFASTDGRRLAVYQADAEWTHAPDAPVAAIVNLAPVRAIRVSKKKPRVHVRILGGEGEFENEPRSVEVGLGLSELSVLLPVIQETFPNVYSVIGQYGTECEPGYPLLNAELLDSFTKALKLITVNSMAAVRMRCLKQAKNADGSGPWGVWSTEPEGAEFYGIIMPIHEYHDVTAAQLPPWLKARVTDAFAKEAAKEKAEAAARKKAAKTPKRKRAAKKTAATAAG